IVSYDTTLDVLAQQIVAEAACRDCSEDELFALVRGAWPYRAIERSQFDAVVAMVSEGFATKRGHRAALVHRDEVNQRVRGRRAATSSRARSATSARTWMRSSTAWVEEARPPRPLPYGRSLLRPVRRPLPSSIGLNPKRACRARPPSRRSPISPTHAARSASCRRRRRSFSGGSSTNRAA